MPEIANETIAKIKECEQDAEAIHNVINKLPANVYMALYRRMHVEISEDSSFIAPNPYGPYACV